MGLILKNKRTGILVICVEFFKHIQCVVKLHSKTIGNGGLNFSKRRQKHEGNTNVIGNIINSRMSCKIGI